MLQDKEFEIRLQFLEEAQEYLNTIESALLELATAYIDSQIDAVLRATHSIKGGAAMMGFQTLSNLAHRLEDFFKVLKTQRSSIDAELQSLLLAGVDCLYQVIALYHQGLEAHNDVPILDEQWLKTHVDPAFDRLYQRLGNSPPVDTATMLLPEDGQDMVALIFESEVEERLQHLETILADSKEFCLFEEISTMAQDFAGLGEMLQLNSFRSLCESITQHLETTPERVAEIAHLALQEWRRSQVALLVDQVDILPNQLNLDLYSQIPDSPTVTNPIAIDVPNPLSELVEFPIDIGALSEAKQKSSLPNHLKENQENTVRVPIKLLEQLNDLFGELTIERNGINLYIERLRNLVRILKHRIQSLRRQDTSHSDTSANNVDSDLSRDRDIHRLPLEIIENIVRVQEVTDDIDLSLEDTDQTVGELNRTAKQLQTTITQVRMRPLSDLVERFPRFLRELSTEYGKQVSLKLHGDGTLIDRFILEALNDPLRHLLRNAFDHGIEDPEIRQELGKSEQGVIEIRAAHRGNQTLITVRDDGGGINLDKIRRRASHLGLDVGASAQPADGITAASDEELLNLIFEPGFSTADQVTTLSGRGIGLDVVRTNLRQIRGDIKVDTQLGLGTTFTLSVPLTLSVARVLLVETNGNLLALPSDVVEEMLLLNPEQVFTIAGQEVLSWKEYMPSLVRLGQWLEFRRPQKKAYAELMPVMSVPTVLMIDQGSEWVGLQVDRCWGEQEVAVRKVEGAVTMPPGFSGCTILGDGRVVPLVNAPELLRWIASCKQPYSLERGNKLSMTTGHQSQKDTILVVDDSINVRRFLSLTLEKAGYRVEQAKDGQDALEKLLSESHFRAVICDIDMPRLDGYGLLARLKSNPVAIPIVMLTSRSGHKDRQLAMNLGATAYFSKPYNEQELLQALKQLLYN